MLDECLRPVAPPRHPVDLRRGADDGQAVAGSAVALAVSLHASNDALRDGLIPLNKKYSAEELMAACKRYLEFAPRDFITFEYCMLDGVNDSDEHARELLALVQDREFGVNCKFNLIPFNPFPESGLFRSKNPRIKAFAQVLMDGGIITTVRKTRGDDIDAACGQLAGEVRGSHAGAGAHGKDHSIPTDIWRDFGKIVESAPDAGRHGLSWRTCRGCCRPRRAAQQAVLPPQTRSRLPLSSSAPPCACSWPAPVICKTSLSWLWPKQSRRCNWCRAAPRCAACAPDFCCLRQPVAAEKDFSYACASRPTIPVGRHYGLFLYQTGRAARSRSAYFDAAFQRSRLWHA